MEVGREDHCVGRRAMVSTRGSLCRKEGDGSGSRTQEEERNAWEKLTAECELAPSASRK